MIDETLGLRLFWLSIDDDRSVMFGTIASKCITSRLAPKVLVRAIDEADLSEDLDSLFEAKHGCPTNG